VIPRKPYARMEVALPAPGEAAVRIDATTPGSGRGLAADRLDLTLGLMAWTVHGMHEDHGPAFGEAIRRLAAEIADSPDGTVAAGSVRASVRGGRSVDVQFTEWPRGRGGTRVRIDLVRSAVGPVTVLRDKGASPQVLGLVALVAAAWACSEEDAHGRLALALAMEGLLVWYREAHHMTPPRQAVEAARIHAVDRLHEAGRAVPPALAGTPGA